MVSTIELFEISDLKISHKPSVVPSFGSPQPNALSRLVKVDIHLDRFQSAALIDYLRIRQPVLSALLQEFPEGSPQHGALHQLYYHFVVELIPSQEMLQGSVRFQRGLIYLLVF